MNLFEYIKSQLPQMPNVAIMKQLGASDELVEYVKETTWNTNLNVMGSIAGSGSGGDAEVWLVGNTGEELGGKMAFALSNVDATDHITELFNNSSNHILYINDDTELTFNEEYSTTEGEKIWADSALTVSISVAVVGTQGYASALFENASTAPTSVEVSVKVK